MPPRRPSFEDEDTLEELSTTDLVPVPPTGHELLRPLVRGGPTVPEACTTIYERPADRDDVEPTKPVALPAATTRSGVGDAERWLARRRAMLAR